MYPTDTQLKFLSLREHKAPGCRVQGTHRSSFNAPAKHGPKGQLSVHKALHTPHQYHTLNSIHISPAKSSKPKDLHPDPPYFTQQIIQNQDFH
jgi:hypothetical protein